MVVRKAWPQVQSVLTKMRYISRGQLLIRGVGIGLTVDKEYLPTLSRDKHKHDRNVMCIGKYLNHVSAMFVIYVDF